MLAKVSTFMSIIFIVQTQIIKRTEEGTYGRWIRSTRLNHLVLKMSCVAAICKEGLGTLVFQNQFPLEGQLFWFIPCPICRNHLFFAHVYLLVQFLPTLQFKVTLV